MGILFYKTEALYAELNKKVEEVSSSYSGFWNFYFTIYLVCACG